MMKTKLRDIDRCRGQFYIVDERNVIEAERLVWYLFNTVGLAPHDTYVAYGCTICVRYFKTPVNQKVFKFNKIERLYMSIVEDIVEIVTYESLDSDESRYNFCGYRGTAEMLDRLAVVVKLPKV